MEDYGAEIIGFLVLGLPILLLLGALVIGRWLEQRHFRSIRAREEATCRFPAVPTRSWDRDAVVVDARLVSASVVVSLDHFKKFLARLRNIFGGNIRSYESLLDRGKREAILRLKEQVPDFHIIVNLRLTSSNIASIQHRNQGVGGIEVLAFGTAVQYASDPQPHGSMT